MEYDTSMAVTHKDIYYPSIGLFIARSRNLSLAVKAGDNDDNHNHNDTGSLTLYKNGRPVLVDIGVESYTGKTFSPQRYEIWSPAIITCLPLRDWTSRKAAVTAPRR